MQSAEALRDHLCPICDGDGDRHCFCDGRGVITQGDAEAFAAELDEEPKRLPPPPAEMRNPCHDCAFRKDSPEWDSGTIYQIALRDEPFYCHAGMHCTADGRYIPQNAPGEPMVHPVCAGWKRTRGTAFARAEDQAK